MRVHHLNCGTLCPSGGARLVLGEGGIFEQAKLVCHCLLVETNDGLVLVDTGVGLHDVEDPSRLGRGFVRRNSPRLDREETAIAQVRRLGFDPRDVRHLVPTHLDLDHAGGLADFPWATVHVFRDELEAARAPVGSSAKYGFRPAQWAHGPRWSVYEVEGDRFFGLESVRLLPGLDVPIALVPLVGHSEGHCGVAVDTGNGFLLHAGDAYFSHREIDPIAPSAPIGLELFQRLRSVDDAKRRANRETLRALARDHARELAVFSAHCPVEWERASARQAAR